MNRHAYAVRARVFLPGPSGIRSAGRLSYVYRGLGNPTLGVSLLQNWAGDGARIRQGNAARDTFFVLERARGIAVSLTLARQKIRSDLSLALSGGLVREDREVLDRALQLTDQLQLDRPSNALGEVSARFSAPPRDRTPFRWAERPARLSLSAPGAARTSTRRPGNPRGIDHSIASSASSELMRGCPGDNLLRPCWPCGRARGPHAGRAGHRVF